MIPWFATATSCIATQVFQVKLKPILFEMFGGEGRWAFGLQFEEETILCAPSPDPQRAPTTSPISFVGWAKGATTTPYAWAKGMGGAARLASGVAV